MIYERVVYISMHTSQQYLHSVRPSINDPANTWWSVNPQLLIISDNESLWRLINIWSVTAWTFISSRRPRGNGCAIDARCDLYPEPSRAIIQSVARPGSLGNFVRLCLCSTRGCMLFMLLLVTGWKLLSPLEMNQIKKNVQIRVTRVIYFHNVIHTFYYITQDEHVGSTWLKPVFAPFNESYFLPTLMQRCVSTVWEIIHAEENGRKDMNFFF